MGRPYQAGDADVLDVDEAHEKKAGGLHGKFTFPSFLCLCNEMRSYRANKTSALIRSSSQLRSGERGGRGGVP